MLYCVVNFVIQSVIQPKIVGDAVGLSATMSFLSLVFWAWVLGPLGALLAIPLSLLTKGLLVDIDPATQWIGPLISAHGGTSRPGQTGPPGTAGGRHTAAVSRAQRPGRPAARGGTTRRRDPQHGQWDARVAHLLRVAPPRLRPPIAWLARSWVGRLLGRTTAGLVRVQIFDRSMTLAAQAFTSIFPVLILLAAVLGGGQSGRLADFAHLPPTSRYVIDDALGRGGIGAFGVVGSLVVLISSTGLARALARAYAAVWSVHQTPGGPRASWRWLVTVLTLALFAVGSRLLGWFDRQLPLRGLVSALLLLAMDCAIGVLMPWLLLGAAVPMRMLLPGSILFGLVMLFVRPAGAVYLPRALQTSADRYGTIGVAFTYIGWLYVVAFCSCWPRSSVR